MQRALAGALAFLLVAGVTAAAESPCRPTRPDALGPFYVPGAPERSNTGRGFVVSGVVRSDADCRPLGGATIEWWSTNASGAYDAAHRATQRSDGAGRYRYETSFPGVYPGRPPHLHVRVTAPGHHVLVTQLYPAVGESVVAQDFVLLVD